MWTEAWRSKEGTTVLSIKENKVMLCCESGITYHSFESKEEAEREIVEITEGLEAMDNFYEWIKLNAKNE